MHLMHHTSQETTLLVQMFLSTVILDMSCLEVVPVLAMAVVYGIHQLHYVVMKILTVDLMNQSLILSVFQTVFIATLGRNLFHW